MNKFGTKKIFDDRMAYSNFLLFSLVLIAAENTFLNQVNKVPELIDDVSEAGKLSKMILLVEIEIGMWMWKSMGYAKSKPVKETFFEDLDILIEKCLKSLKYLLISSKTE